MHANISPGSKAPDFTSVDQQGRKISLKDFRGKKLVIYFYPQDLTPTCTVQACNMRDNYKPLQDAGFSVIGISPDDERKHKKFADKYQLPFPLLVDTDLKIIKRYGAWGDKVLFGREYEGVLRTTFVIDEKGIIRHIITRPKSKSHAEEILALQM